MYCEIIPIFGLNFLNLLEFRLKLRKITEFSQIFDLNLVYICDFHEIIKFS